MKNNVVNPEIHGKISLSIGIHLVHMKDIWNSGSVMKFTGIFHSFLVSHSYETNRLKLASV